jgi:hypothetical protein
VPASAIIGGCCSHCSGSAGRSSGRLHPARGHFAIAPTMKIHVESDVSGAEVSNSPTHSRRPITRSTTEVLRTRVVVALAAHAFAASEPGLR